MTITILIYICILNAVVVVRKNDSIIWMCVPLLVLSLEAIILIKRIEVVSSIEVSIVRTEIISLEIVVLSLR